MNQDKLYVGIDVAARITSAISCIPTAVNIVRFLNQKKLRSCSACCENLSSAAGHCRCRQADARHIYEHHPFASKQIKEYDKAIEKMLEAFHRTDLDQGIGNIYAAGIIAEIGDINRFPSQAGLAKYAGLVWTQHQSSDFEAGTSA